MRDAELRSALTRIESAEAASDAAVERARSAMFDAFDADVFVEESDEQPAAEITLLNRATGSVRERRKLEWILLPAAAVLFIALVATFLAPSRSEDPSQVAASGAIESEPIGESTPEPTVSRVDPAWSTPFYSDGDLPRLIEGEFRTEVFGGETSFTLDEPMWLVAHETGIVELLLAEDAPESGRLIIARDPEPVASPTLGSPLEVLASGVAGINGQVQPYLFDGLPSTYWRGRVDRTHPSFSDCLPNEACVALWLAPGSVGLNANVTNDIIVADLAGGDTLVVAATIPFDRFDLEPFANAFDEIVQTIDFGFPDD